MHCDVRFGSKADICSAKGQVRFAPIATAKANFPQTVMSVLPPRAGMRGATSDDFNVPIADIPILFDYPVGGGEQCRRNRKANRLCGLEVDH
jgi:hypothetical protein